MDYTTEEGSRGLAMEPRRPGRGGRRAGAGRPPADPIARAQIAVLKAERALAAAQDVLAGVAMARMAERGR